nr:hypothetical protein [uncultured Sphingomonas sp.]
MPHPLRVGAPSLPEKSDEPARSLFGQSRRVIGLDDDVIAAARRLYESQKLDLLSLTRETLANDLCDEMVQPIARLLHNIAGTARYFDDEMLGQNAVSIEAQLAETVEPHVRRLTLVRLTEILNDQPES